MAKGLALKALSWFLRVVEFCCAVIILGIFAYYISIKHTHGLYINTTIKAVEGISAAATLYTLVALILVCFLGGIAIFSMLGMLLDLGFTGAFIYLAYATRHGAKSCSGFVQTPFGSGNPKTLVVASTSGSGGLRRLPSLRTACRLQKATFAVAIIGAIFFFLSIFIEYGLIRHRKKEKAYNHHANNNAHTAGQPKRKFWQRKPKQKTTYVEKNGDTLPSHTTPSNMRPSYATDATAVGGTGVGEPPYQKYNTPVVIPGGGHNQHGNHSHVGGVAGVGHPHERNQQDGLLRDGNQRDGYMHEGTQHTGVGHQHPGTTANGYSTTTTTRTGHGHGLGSGNGVGNGHGSDGYVRTHQPYNQNPTAPVNERY